MLKPFWLLASGFHIPLFFLRDIKGEALAWFVLPI